MSDSSDERTLLVIAAEINTITHQTKKILLTGAVEIGRRLKDAKALVKRGEWLNWLKESVNYSKSTAENLMRIYEEYGPSLLNLSGDDPNSQTFGNLTYSQALLLLGLPEEEREEFVTENDVGGMTVKELQQVLEERDQANQEKDQAMQEKGRVLQENEVLKKGLETIDGTITKLKEEQAKALPQPAAASPDADTSAAADTSTNADTSLASRTLPEPSANFTHNLPTEPDPNAAAKYVERCDACRQTIADTFYALTTALTNLTYIDVALKEEKRKEAQKLLDAIATTIKVWPPAKKPLKVIG